MEKAQIVGNFKLLGNFYFSEKIRYFTNLNKMMKMLISNINILNEA